MGAKSERIGSAGTGARRGVLAAALGLGLLLGGLGPTVAQDGTPAAGRQAAPPHPAHIHAGNCDEGGVGEVVAPLTELVTPEGRNEGSRGASTAASSFTNVPLTLDAILAADHVVNVHLSAEEIDVYIACGELGGARDASGNLVVGLREFGNSGYFGIAYLAPGADGASTDVSVFVAEGRGGGGGRNRDAADDATPAAGGMDEMEGMDEMGDDASGTPDAGM